MIIIQCYFIFSAEEFDKCPSIIPHIRSPISGSSIKTSGSLRAQQQITHDGRHDSTPSSPVPTPPSSPSPPSSPPLPRRRTQIRTTPSASSISTSHLSSTNLASPCPTASNKYLTTFGFASTCFIGEAINGDASWTVTVKRNGNNVPSTPSTSSNTSDVYLFGAGISSEALGIKAMVGMGERSYAIVCSGGSLCFSHNGKHERLAQLPGLPLALTLSVYTAHPKYTILMYKLQQGGTERDGDRMEEKTTGYPALVGWKVINDAELKRCIHPAFTVSQRVKMLFHTFV